MVEDFFFYLIKQSVKEFDGPLATFRFNAYVVQALAIGDFRPNQKAFNSRFRYTQLFHDIVHQVLEENPKVFLITPHEQIDRFAPHALRVLLHSQTLERILA